METDEWIHSTDPDAEGFEHVSSPDCWCVPVRVRKNGLTGKVEHWDRVGVRWVAVEDLPDLGRSELAVPEVIDAPELPVSTRRVEDEIADRAAMQEEDAFWRGVD